jgi:hypothetical protein
MILATYQLKVHVIYINNIHIYQSILKKGGGGKMETRKKKEPFYADTVNSLAHQDKYFHWSTTYQWYSSLTPEKKLAKKIWTTGLAKVGLHARGF